MSNLRKGLVVAVSSILAALVVGASPAPAQLVPWRSAIEGYLVAHGADPGKVGGMTDEEIDAELEKLGGAPFVSDPSKISNVEIEGLVMGQQGDMTIIEVHIGGWTGILQVPTVDLAYLQPPPPPPASGTQGEVDWTNPDVVDNSMNCYERADSLGVPPEEVC